MSPVIAQFGAILYHLGAIAALLIAAPVLYGLVIVMRRWWMVVVATALLLGAIAWVSYNPDIAVLARQIPQAMQPDVQSYVVVAMGYVLLAALVRLSTLRLEWRGWKQKSLRDIHVLGFLAPTVAAFYVSFMPV